MALDGLFLRFLKIEIERKALGARVEKIAQPSREELVLHLRGRDGTHKLLLSGGAMGPRVHFIESAPENPKTPPMLCMLLRKHLTGARLARVDQVGLDRVLRLGFEATNELGDPCEASIVIEIMGRHSNIIVMDGGDKIIDAIRRVDISTSRVRQVLPGMKYVLPPAQEKLSVLDIPPDRIIAKLRGGRDIELSKAMMETLEGFSALVCREAAYYATRGEEVNASSITEEQEGRLAFFLGGIRSALEEGSPVPTMLLEAGVRPKDFCCFAVHQYGVSMVTREYPDCSALLDGFYAERGRVERLRQRSGDLLNNMAAAADRLARKLSLQREELLACKDREGFRQKGDLIGASLYAIQKGDAQATVQNFYDPNGGEITIELDPRLTPTQNAQRYYALYRKADTAEKYLTRLIEEGERELVYLESVLDALARADGEAELEAVRSELVASGYGKRAKKSGAKKGGREKEQKLPPLRFRSVDGFVIFCGRNNTQNDRLTLKEAASTDLWLHTQKIPGSHVIVSANGENIPDSTIEQAAVIAAYHSKGRQSSKVPVDYTQVRNVKKPAGAKPGMVIYETYRTILTDPDELLVKSLAITE